MISPFSGAETHGSATFFLFATASFSNKYGHICAFSRIQGQKVDAEKTKVKSQKA
jgi:xanthine/uracil permease